MQLCTAVLQHASSVLPAVQQQGPHLAADLQSQQAAAVGSVISLSSGVMAPLSECQVYWFDKGDASAQQGRAAQTRQQLEQLLLSPHCVPFVALLLVLTALYVRKACTGKQAASSSSSSSSRVGRGKVASSSGTSGRTPTPCQLKLLEPLGVLQLEAAVAATVQAAPEAASAVLDIPDACLVSASLCCFSAVNASNNRACAAARQQGTGSDQQQRWRLEQQLLGLLPSVLVPCAVSYLLRAAASEDQQQQHRHQLTAAHFVNLSQRAMTAIDCLPGAGGRTGPAGGPCSLPHPSWVEEVLGGVLQLAGQVLPAQQPQPAVVAAAGSPTAASGIAQQRSRAAASATLSGSSGSRSRVIADVVDLLAVLVGYSAAWLSLSSNQQTCVPSESLVLAGGSSSSDRAASSAAGVADPFPPQLAVAEGLVEVCTTLEAGLRAVTAAEQASPACTKILQFIDRVVDYLFLGTILTPSSNRCALLLHLGLAGPEALPAQLQQLYSLLSTVQKLGQCQSAVLPGELCWGQDGADACCWAAGQTAVMLLQAAQPAAGSSAVQADPALSEAAAAAVMQLPESGFLPSLVILGRCCLVWAEQLQQQVDTQARQLHLAWYNAAWVCIPRAHDSPSPPAEEGRAAAAAAAGNDLLPPSKLEHTVNAVSAWVGDIMSSATLNALAAAGGGESSEQFVQQLEALAAAQQAARQGLSDALLSALVQQLQATGAMLSRIAVPHFCNNAGCGNIGGPTEAGLVSGRSCLCGGCLTARYCGRACQRAAWPQHKRVCKALAALAAAQAAESDGAAAAAASSTQV